MFLPPRATTASDSLNLLGIAGSNYAQTSNLASVAISGSYADLASAPPPPTLDSVTANGNLTTNSATLGGITSGGLELNDGSPGDGFSILGLQLGGNQIIDQYGNINPAGTYGSVQSFATDPAISSDGDGNIYATSIWVNAIGINGQKIATAVVQALNADNGDPEISIPAVMQGGKTWGVAYQATFTGPWLQIPWGQTNLASFITLYLPTPSTGYSEADAIVEIRAIASSVGAYATNRCCVQISRYQVMWGGGVAAMAAPIDNLVMLGGTTNNTTSLAASLSASGSGTNSAVVILLSGNSSGTQKPTQWTVFISILGSCN